MRLDGRNVAAALVALALGTCGAHAAEVSAEQATALQGQLQTWLAGVFGPGLTPGPVRVAAEDDHYALSVLRSGGLAGTDATIEAPPFTADARPLDGGRWALDAIRLPSPMRVTVPLPGDKGPGVLTITMRDQQSHALIDPSLGTTSSWDTTLRDYETMWQGPDTARRTAAAQIVTHITWQPTAAGRLDVTEEATSDLIASNSVVKDRGTASFSAARSRLTAHIDALAPARVPAIIQAAVELWPVMMSAAREAAAAGHRPPHWPPHWPASLTPSQHAMLGAALDALGDLMAGFGEDAAMEDVHLRARGLDASMRRASFGMAMAAPEGLLALRMRVALDGLDSAAFPAGNLHGYLPRHIAFSPRIGGVRAAPLLALLRTALDSDGRDPALDRKIHTLLRGAPLTLGLDGVRADFGPATLAAHGEMRFSGSGAREGEAEIRVTGLDALMRDARTAPELTGALPVLAFLKGLGEADGAATVWKVSYRDGKTLLNGADLSQMLPGK